MEDNKKKVVVEGKEVEVSRVKERKEAREGKGQWVRMVGVVCFQ